MRNGLLVLLLVCGVVQWDQHQAREAVEAGQEEVAAVAAAPPGLLGRLGLQMGPAPDSEPAPARMVHCVIDGDGAFLRHSECLASGGAIDEPSWARSEH